MDSSAVYMENSSQIVHFPKRVCKLETVVEDLSAADDLAGAFSRVRQEVRAGARMMFRLLVEGQPRGLDPLVRNAVYRFGREALLNAFRHSGASRVEVDVEYERRYLRVVVRDDGRGITRLFLTNHSGLSGMRELAERIGAKFKLLSRAAAGTEVELSIPGRIAYMSQAESRTVARACA